MHRIFDWFTAQYYRLWACPRGKHYWKFSGCMYCGAGGKQQPKFYI